MFLSSFDSWSDLHSATLCLTWLASSLCHIQISCCRLWRVLSSSSACWFSTNLYDIDPALLLPFNFVLLLWSCCWLQLILTSAYFMNLQVPVLHLCTSILLTHSLKIHSIPTIFKSQVLMPILIMLPLVTNSKRYSTGGVKEALLSAWPLPGV